MARACVTMRAAILKSVSRATSFEMIFSKTVSDNIGVSILCLSLVLEVALYTDYPKHMS